MTIAAEEIITRLALQGRSQYSAELQAASRSVAAFRGEVAGTGNVLTSTFGRLTMFGGGLSSITGIARTAATAVLGIGIATAFVGVKLVDTAANADKAHGRYQTVFGDMTSDVDKFIGNLQTKFGTPTDVLESATAQFGRMAQSVGISREQLPGFAEDLTQAGVDLASFYNLDPGAVFVNLQRGVAGQMRGLKSLGIVIRETDVTQRASEMGFGKHATEQQRMLIRQQMIMEQVRQVTGNLSKDSGGLANQQRELKNRMHELEVTAGRVLMPLELLAVRGLNNLLIPATQHLKDMLPGLQERFSSTGDVVDRLRPVVAFLGEGLSALTSGGPIGFVDWLDRVLNTGAFLHTMVSGWITIFTALYHIFIGGVLPVLHTFAPLLTFASVNVWLVSHALDFLSNNLGIVKIAMLPVVAYLVIMGIQAEFAMVRTLALGIVTAATRVPYMIATVAGWAHIAMLVVTGQTETVLIGTQSALAVSTWAALGPYLALAALFIAVAVATYLVLDNFGALTDATVGLFTAVWDNPFGKMLIAMTPVGAAAVAIWAIFSYGPAIVAGVGNAIEQTFGDVMGVLWAVQGFASTMWFGMVDGVKAAFNAVIDVLETGINFGLEIVNQGITAVNHLPGVYVDHVDYVSIPRLHSGGTVMAPGLVNYRPGEEIIGLPSGATVTPVPAPAMAGGPPPGSSRPMIVQLVMPDRKVLAEVMVDGADDRDARR